MKYRYANLVPDAVHPEVTIDVPWEPGFYDAPPTLMFAFEEDEVRYGATYVLVKGDPDAR